MCWVHCIVLWVGQVQVLHRLAARLGLNIEEQVREHYRWTVLKGLGKQGELLGRCTEVQEQVHCIEVQARERCTVVQGRVRERCIAVQEREHCKQELQVRYIEELRKGQVRYIGELGRELEHCMLA